MFGWLRGLIKFGVIVSHFGFAPPVEQTERQGWCGGEQQVVQADGPPFEENLAGPGRVDGEPQLHDVERDVLVERVQNEPAHAVVVECAVDEQEPAQEAELSDRVVGSARRLQALVARDADADARLLDHGHVVGAVADGQRHLARLLRHRVHHLRLLAGRHPAADHRPALEAQQQKVLLQVATHGVLERCAVDDERHGRRVARRRVIALRRQPATNHRPRTLAFANNGPR